MMRDESDRRGGEAGWLQFSLTTLLLLVAVAALVAASVTELPDWVGAPLLALVATGAAAAVVTAAIRSRGYALTFYVGAALPLCMLAIRTAHVLGALSQGVMQERVPVTNGGWMQMYGQGFPDQRLLYRWEVATVLAFSPLIGLLCVALHWLKDRERYAPPTSEKRIDGRLRRTAIVTCLIVGVPALIFLVVRSHPMWEVHDGSPVSPSGNSVSATSRLSRGDRVLVEQSGSWWRGRVKQITADGNVLIHYVGWESNWDETVPLSRLQLP